MGLTEATPRVAPRRAPVVIPVQPASEQNLFNLVGYPCVLLFLFFFYSRILDLGLYYLRLPMIMAIVAILTTLGSGNLQKVFRSRISVTMLVLTAWMFVTVPFSIWRSGSISVLSDKWLKAIAMFMAIGCLVTSLPKLARIMRWIAWGLVLACGLALAFNAVDSDGRLGLPAGELSNANHLAYAATNGIALLWAMLGNRRQRLVYRILAGFGMVIALYTLSRTGSRAGLLTLAVMLAMAFVAASLKQRIAVILAVGVMVGLLMAPGAIQRRFITYLSSSPASESGMSAVESAQVRLDLLKYGVALTLHHPLFGVGPGNFIVSRANETEKTLGQGDWHVTHNTFVQISSECGVPGLVLYLLLLGFCFHILGRVRKRARAFSSQESEDTAHTALCIKLCLVNTIGFFLFSSSAYECYLPTLAGLIVAFERITMTAAPAQTAQLAAGETPVPAQAGATPQPARRNRPGLMP